MLIYTIGHSSRSLDQFIKLLKKYGIKRVIDVRRFPVSTKYPHFNRENLEKSLKSSKIKYFWLGDLLGGYRSGGYEKYMETDQFKEGIEKLLSITLDRKTAIMCAEIVWFRCHRRFISDHLVGMGHKVVHIIDEKRIYEHKLRNQRPNIS